MNETLKKWIDALRSGKYGQTTETLCDDKGNYCCLGVLEHVMTGDVEREADGKPGIMISHEFEMEHRLSRDDMFNTGISAWDLSSLNDNGLTFAEIADKLEGKA